VRPLRVLFFPYTPLFLSHQNFSGLHNGTYSHGIRLPWHLIPAFKKPFVSLNGTLIQIHTVGSHNKRRSRFIKTNMAVQPKPQKRSEEHTSELQSRFDLVC